jgi:hypothetical protein
VIGRTLRLLAAGLLSVGMLVPATAEEPAPTADQLWTSRDHKFQARVESSLQPLSINRLHHWTLHLESSAGEPLVGASIEVRGGMPAHDHGLPTLPQVSRGESAGVYWLEGMRFHMPGEWEVMLVIKTGTVTDSILIPLRL